MPPRARTVTPPLSGAEIPPIEGLHDSGSDLVDDVASDGLFEAPEPPPYAIPPARTVREAPARMLRVREVVQEIRDDVAALIVSDAVDPDLAAAVVGLANCVEALAEINT